MSVGKFNLNCVINKSQCVFVLPVEIIVIRINPESAIKWFLNIYLILIHRHRHTYNKLRNFQWVKYSQNKYCADVHREVK